MAQIHRREVGIEVVEGEASQMIRDGVARGGGIEEFGQLFFRMRDALFRPG